MIAGKIAVLKILVLGGTHFLGFHLTEELQKNGLFKWLNNKQ